MHTESKIKASLSTEWVDYVEELCGVLVRDVVGGG